jgi:hypothetical protein
MAKYPPSTLLCLFISASYLDHPIWYSFWYEFMTKFCHIGDHQRFVRSLLNDESMIWMPTIWDGGECCNRNASNYSDSSKVGKKSSIRSAKHLGIDDLCPNVEPKKNAKFRWQSRKCVGFG